MLVRNLLKAGYFVEPIPLGIPVTLEYDDTGTFKKVWRGVNINEYKSSTTPLESLPAIYSYMLTHRTVPTHVQSQNGSMFVQGVVYTGTHPVSCFGELPSCVEDSLISDISHNKLNFNFFAGNVLSTSVNFSGSAQIRNWLKVQTFNILPGFIIPQGDVEISIRKQLDSTPFSYESIIGYFIIRGSKCDIEFLGNSQNKIKQIREYIDESGHIGAILDFTSKSDLDSLKVNYYEVVKKQLTSGAIVLMDSSNGILSKYPVPKMQVFSKDYECPICGKHYVISEEFSMCPDEHCLSRLYPDIKHFLSRLNLDVISYERYIKEIRDRKITKFSDILLLDNYRDIEIEVSIFDFIDAVIPIRSVRNRQDIWALYGACNGSWDSIQYYINNPRSIASDLNIVVDDLANWLLDDQNKAMILETALYTNVTFIPYAKRFDGSPIFRDKHIFLTGKFSHGSIAEVESILRSYSAEITDYKEADCAIIGDIPEGINGTKINKLKNKNIPIFKESEFFTMYDIDTDLSIY